MNQAEAEERHELALMELVKENGERKKARAASPTAGGGVESPGVREQRGNRRQPMSG